MGAKRKKLLHASLNGYAAIFLVAALGMLLLTYAPAASSEWGVVFPILYFLFSALAMALAATALIKNREGSSVWVSLTLMASICLTFLLVIANATIIRAP